MRRACQTVLPLLGVVVLAGWVLAMPGSVMAQGTAGGSQAQADVVAQAVAAYQGGATMQQAMQQAMAAAGEQSLDMEAVVASVQQQVQSIATQRQAVELAQANGRTEPNAQDMAQAASQVAGEMVSAVDAAAQIAISDPAAQSRVVADSVMTARGVATSAGASDGDVTASIGNATSGSPNAPAIQTASNAPPPSDTPGGATYIPPTGDTTTGGGGEVAGVGGEGGINVPAPPPNSNNPGDNGPTDAYSSSTGGV